MVECRGTVARLAGWERTASFHVKLAVVLPRLLRHREALIHRTIVRRGLSYSRLPLSRLEFVVAIL